MKKRNPNPEYMTLGEAATFLDMHYVSLRRIVKRGTLKPDVEIGGRKFFLTKKIKKLVKSELLYQGCMGRGVLKPPTEKELHLLTAYALGKLRGREVAEKLGLNNKQRVGQVIQSIAYRKFYFDILKKHDPKNP